MEFPKNLFFKEKRHENEILEILPIGFKILSFICDWASKNTKYKNVVITHVLRTQEEQDELYKGTTFSRDKTRKYDLKPWVSPHQLGMAFDLRSWHYSVSEIQEMLVAINAKFQYNDKRTSEVATYHKISGNVYHFHVQFNPETKIIDETFSDVFYW